MINILNASDETKNLIVKVYLQTLEYLSLNDCFDIDITFVGEKAIKKLNFDYRGIDKVTDVLSFPNVNLKFPIDISEYPLDINPETNRIMLGDILICKKRANEQAMIFGHSVVREKAFLALHGILHLLGFDHILAEEEKEMIKIQHAILEKLNIGR